MRKWRRELRAAMNQAPKNRDEGSIWERQKQMLLWEMKERVRFLP